MVKKALRCHFGRGLDCEQGLDQAFAVGIVGGERGHHWRDRGRRGGGDDPDAAGEGAARRGGAILLDKYQQTDLPEKWRGGKELTTLLKMGGPGGGAGTALRQFNGQGFQSGNRF